jgi:prepilin-type N-terminal cleavage/methylation domain-containing protein
MALNKKGFTLVELMVVIAIIGILVATAIPAYNVIRQRIYGSEAKVMLNQIINAQVAYYLENNRYYGEGTRFDVYHVGQEPENAVKMIYDNLHLEIPQGHFVDYSLSAYADSEGSKFVLVITANREAGFNLFNGASQVTAFLNEKGEVDISFSNSD